MIPHRTPFFLPWVYPSLTWRMRPDENILYLTFDDGPVRGPTEYALDTLASRNARATFFCIGDNIRKQPGIFAKILADGHSVGNHTVHHLKGWNTPADDYLADAIGFDAIAAAAGMAKPTRLFRPPYGRITRKQIRMLAHYRIVMWDVLTQDYDHRLSGEQCLRRTVEASRPGSIVVFHDSYKAQRNMEYVLPRLIDHFKAKNFRFEAL